MSDDFKKDVEIAGPVVQLKKAISGPGVHLWSETSVTWVARLSCFLIVLKVMWRFMYIPTYIWVKRKHCGHTHTLVTWVYNPHNVCFFEIRDFYYKMSKLHTEGTVKKKQNFTIWGNSANQLKQRFQDK